MMQLLFVTGASEVYCKIYIYYPKDYNVPSRHIYIYDLNHETDLSIEYISVHFIKVLLGAEFSVQFSKVRIFSGKTLCT